MVNNGTGGAARLTGLVGVNANVVPRRLGRAAAQQRRHRDRNEHRRLDRVRVAFVQDTQAYAIPIGKAVSMVRQIEAGRASARVHIGATSFLGVQVASALRNGDFTAPGAVIAGVLRGSPAASAGISPGDVITAIDGRTTSSPSSITAAILAKQPGTKVTIRLTDRSGVVRSTIVTLVGGPAQ